MRQRLLGPLLGRWLALRWDERNTDLYDKAHDGAVEELAGRDEPRKSLLEAGKARREADEAVEVEEAMLQRFTSVYAHIVEAGHLRAHAKPEVKAGFEKLWNAEQGTLPLAAPR